MVQKFNSATQRIVSAVEGRWFTIANMEAERIALRNTNILSQASKYLCQNDMRKSLEEILSKKR